MSESSEASEAIETTEKQATIVKAKRQLTQAQLDNLKAAREKAMIKRRELGQITQREKQAKEDLLNQRIKQVAKLEKVVNKTTKKKKKIVESSSESSSESSESSEEEEVIVKPKKLKKVVRQPKTSSDERVLNDIAKQNLKDKIMQSTYRAAYSSIFPGQVNPY
jgi:hypothetical protein